MTYAELLNTTAVSKSRNMEEAYKIQILNTAQNMIWRRFDWRWTLDTLPSFYLIPRKQDYGAPIVAVPADWDGLRQARLCFWSPGSEPRKIPLSVQRDLESTGNMGVPNSISYQADTASFRVHPRPHDSCAAPRYFIDGTYKKTPTAVTLANYQTSSIPGPSQFTDKYADMWRQVINWAYYSYSQDPKAGGVQLMPSGIPNYYGALGEAMAAMQMAAGEEGLIQGEPFIHPAEALLITGGPNRAPYNPF